MEVSVEQTVNPGVMIGLGGTGDWILSLLKRQLYINYGLVSDEQKGVQFLLLDTLGTDAWEKEQRKSTDGFKVRTSEYIHLGEPPNGFYDWSEDPKNYRDEPYRWFRRDTFRKHYNRAADWSLTKGAGQLRQFARMSLFFNFEKVYQAIHQALVAVAESNGREEVPVWIVGSFAGGTGSGLLLDLAVMVKLITQEQNLPSVRTIGAFVLPDVYADSAADLPQAYAALRELNRFMSQVDMNDQAGNRGRGPDAPFTLRVPYRPNKVFYQSRTIFDNILMFNDTCKNDQDRKSYFNKVVDGITVLFDRAGAHEFYQRVINANEEKLSDFSTYRMFIPMRLYTQKFKYRHLLDMLDELVPTEENLTLKKPPVDRILDIKNRVNNLLAAISPYFSILARLIDDDTAIHEHFEDFGLDPAKLLNELMGFNNAAAHFSAPEMSPNDQTALRNLTNHGLADIEPLPRAEMKKDVAEAKSLYQGELEREYQRRVDHVLPDATEKITALIEANFTDRLKRMMRDEFPANWGLAEFAYFLQELRAELSGEGEAATAGVTSVVDKIYLNHYQHQTVAIREELGKTLSDYSDAQPSGSFFKDYAPVISAMSDLRDMKIKELKAQQSKNIFEILRKAHAGFLKQVAHLRRLADNVNEEITINPQSLKNRFQSESDALDAILDVIPGRFSSIGLKDIPAREYENYLMRQVFEHKPYTDIRTSFDGERFVITYTSEERENGDNKTWDSLRFGTGFWEKISDALEHHIQRHINNYEGITHYLRWAKQRYERLGKVGDFIPDLKSGFREALSASQSLTKDKNIFRGRLIHGDTRFSDADNQDLQDDLTDLQHQLGTATGIETSGTLRDNASGQVLFSDRNSLIFLVSTNALDQHMVPSIQNMERDYKKTLVDPHVAWRTKVYHNFKCDWMMWEIERAIAKNLSQGVTHLSSGVYSWVLEDDTMVDLFVKAVAAGVVRLDEFGIQGKVWICGAPGLRYEDNPHDANVALLTGWDPETERITGNQDLFRALVSFAVDRKEYNPRSIKQIDPVKVEGWIKTRVTEAGGWSDLIEPLADQMELNLMERFNPSNHIQKGDDQTHKSLFLSRIFKYYLGRLA